MKSIKIDILRDFLTILVLGVSPWLFPKSQAVIFTATILVLMLLYRKENISFLIIPLCAMFFPIQVGTGGAEEVVDASLRVSQLVVYLLPIIVAVSYILLLLRKRNKKNLPHHVLVLVAFFLIISLVESIIYGNFLDIAKTSTFVICYFVFSLLIDDNYDRTTFFRFNDIVFYLLSAYSISEFYLGFFPYKDFVPKISEIAILGESRIYSLSCCPLIFVGYLSFYINTLFARMLIYHKKPFFQSLLLLFVSTIAMSRTIFLVEILMFSMFIIIYAKHSKVSKTITLLVIISSVMLLFSRFFGDVLSFAFDRFANSDVSLTSRQNSFSVAWSLFREHPLGQGVYYTQEIPTWAGTLCMDNQFLEYLCRYGVLFIFWLVCLVSPLKNNWYRVKQNKISSGLFFVYCLQILAISFSFIFLNYHCLAMMTIAYSTIFDFPVCEQKQL